MIRPHEPNLVKAAWNIFGKSYEYRAKYNRYKADRFMAERERKRNVEGQMSFEDFPEVMPWEREGWEDREQRETIKVCIKKGKHYESREDEHWSGEDSKGAAGEQAECI